MNKIYIYTVLLLCFGCTVVKQKETVLKDSANMVKKDSGKIIKSNNSNKAETS